MKSSVSGCTLGEFECTGVYTQCTLCPCKRGLLSSHWMYTVYTLYIKYYVTTECIISVNVHGVCREQQKDFVLRVDNVHDVPHNLPCLVMSNWQLQSSTEHSIYVNDAHCNATLLYNEN